jgi:3D (Asp-Asp-Asp) domain-containing protein
MVTRTRWRRRATTGVVIVLGSLLFSALAAFMVTPRVQGSPSPPHALPPAPPYRRTVHLLIQDSQKDWVSHQSTVAEALAEAGIRLGPKDEVFPDLDQPIWDGMPILLSRVRTKLVARDEPILFCTTFRPTQTRFRRLPILHRPGRTGLRRQRYQVVYRDGRATEQQLVSMHVIRPSIPAIVTVPPTYQLASRGYYGGRRVFRMIATAYDPGPQSCSPSADGITAIGLRAGHGVVAVDPAVIPMKARLYVEVYEPASGGNPRRLRDYGYAIAGDIGSAIKGNRIDLGFSSRAEALRFGRREVVVRVLD